MSTESNIAKRFQATAKGQICAAIVILIIGGFMAMSDRFLALKSVGQMFVIYQGYFFAVRQFAYHSHRPATNPAGPVEFSCYKCKKTISALEEDRGNVVKCPFCRKRQFAPK